MNCIVWSESDLLIYFIGELYIVSPEVSYLGSKHFDLTFEHYWQILVYIKVIVRNSICYPPAICQKVLYLDMNAHFFIALCRFTNTVEPWNHMVNISRHTILVEASIDLLPTSQWCAKCSQSYHRGLIRASDGHTTCSKIVKFISNKKILKRHWMWWSRQIIGAWDFYIKPHRASAAPFFRLVKPGSKNVIFLVIFIKLKTTWVIHSSYSLGKRETELQILLEQYVF